MKIEYLVFKNDAPLSVFVFDAKTYKFYKNCVELEKDTRSYNLRYRGIRMAVRNAFDDSGKQAEVELSGERETIEKYAEFMQSKFGVKLKQK
ncbi:hypothetical protein HYT25_02160 [Candidatus Pacearchaeota archaeon]|nr:hypothetical protein [Candidatus Pacearchaeota archaeon]